MDGKESLYVNKPNQTVVLHNELPRMIVVFDQALVDSGCHFKITNESERKVQVRFGFDRHEYIVAGGSVLFELFMMEPCEFLIELLDPLSKDKLKIMLTDKHEALSDYLSLTKPQYLSPPSVVSASPKRKNMEMVYFWLFILFLFLLVTFDFSWHIYSKSDAPWSLLYFYRFDKMIEMYVKAECCS